jgi:hypothetical protein
MVDPEPELAVLRSVAPGVPVVATSAQRGDGIDALTAQLGRGRTGALIGSSGVGKSTLVNALLGHERQVTAEIRAHDDRGRHTTTTRELFALPHGGGLLIDTPGLRLPRRPACACRAWASIPRAWPPPSPTSRSSPPAAGSPTAALRPSPAALRER